MNHNKPWNEGDMIPIDESDLGWGQPVANQTDNFTTFGVTA